MQQQNKFIIVREDLLQDPVTIISEGLLMGRLTECELLLNHPSVSRVQAGIKQIDGEYYVFNLRPSNAIKLNGRPVIENQGLAEFRAECRRNGSRAYIDDAARWTSEHDADRFGGPRLSVRR